MENKKTSHACSHDEIMDRLKELYMDLYYHNGFGQMQLEMKFLKKGQKEVLITCGKEYRFVVDYCEQCETEAR